MKLDINDIISIMSAVGISTVIGTIFNFIQSNKRNQLDYVTEERSKWREKLKEIILELNEDSEETKKKAISKLKIQINPYGNKIEIKNTKAYFMKEGHIWDLLEKEDSIDYAKLTLYIELLLKYDWERSKREVAIKPYDFINDLLRYILLGMVCYCIYLAYSVYEKQLTMLFIKLFLSVIAVLFILLQKKMTRAVIMNPSKKGSEIFWIFLLFYMLPYAYVINNLVDSWNVKNSSAVTYLGFIGLIIYEWFYLSFFETYENNYIREIERYLYPKRKKHKKVIKLTNRIKNRELKLYQYDYDDSIIIAMNKRLKRVKKKITKKNKPAESWRHPILLYKYCKNRRRIVEEVKKWNYKEN